MYNQKSMQYCCPTLRWPFLRHSEANRALREVKNRIPMG